MPAKNKQKGAGRVAANLHLSVTYRHADFLSYDLPTKGVCNDGFSCLPSRNNGHNDNHRHNRNGNCYSGNLRISCR